MKSKAFAIFTLSLLTQMNPLKAQEEPLYDESKVPSYTLPELLISEKGGKINSARQWEKERRGEILSIFASQVYGKTPERQIPMRFETRSVDENALDGKAVRKEVRIHFGKENGKWMDLLLYLPKEASGPVPVFLGLNFVGNQTIHPDPGITISPRHTRYGNEEGFKDGYATEASRGLRIRRWPVEAILARGYGLATAFYEDIQPDRPESFREGIHSLFLEPGQDVPRNGEWAAIGAWAWGLSRALDYLQKDKQVNPRQVIVVGHSRLGKAALWAGAQDERFAMVISNNSGEGGAAITRRKFGETIKVINERFPHWFSEHYKQYNGKEDSLPVDYHQLLALIAPRPVYVASASEDLWADPKGEYLSLYHAGPAYSLYGLQVLREAEPPGVEQPVSTPVMGYHMRKGKHDILLYDWERYMDFADQHFRRR